LTVAQRVVHLEPAEAATAILASVIAALPAGELAIPPAASALPRAIATTVATSAADLQHPLEERLTREAHRNRRARPPSPVF
jgi:hypothetical protein